MLLLLAIAVALAHVLLSLLAIAVSLANCAATVGDCWRALRTVLLSLLASELCCYRWRLLTRFAQCAAVFVGDCLRSCWWRLLSLVVHCAAVVGDCLRSCCWRLLSLVAHCAAVVVGDCRRSCALCTAQQQQLLADLRGWVLLSSLTTTTSRELEQTRACGKKNDYKSKKSLQQSSLQLHSVENR